MRRTRSKNEYGATMIMVAISIVALIAIAALVLDGGNGFASRRATQNAADAAALAATAVLNTCLTTGCVGSEPAINQAAQDSLSANHADATYTCKLIDSTYYQTLSSSDILQDCPTSSTPIVAGVDGVLIIASQTNNTTFGRAENLKTLKAGALGAAQLEKVTPNGTAPFFACGLDVTQGGSFPPILLGPTGDPLQPDSWTVDPAATYNSATQLPVYNVWGPSVPLCGAGNGRSGFHGIVGENSFTLPTWIPDQTGVRAGPIRNQLAGPNACGTQIIVGCHILLPLCVNRRGHGSGVDIYCVKMGEFVFTSVTANSAFAGFLGTASVLGFGAGSGVPGQNDFRVIRLSL